MTRQGEDCPIRSQNMKHRHGFTSLRTSFVLAGAMAAGFAATRIVTHGDFARPTLSKGGVDGAMAQAKVLLSELRDADWEIRKVDQRLLNLPERGLRGEAKDDPHAPSFMRDSVHPEYDEVAFICSTFVDRELTVVPGIEGTLSITGFYIVAWKSGQIDKIDVRDVRLLAIKAGEPSWIRVFPGMDEYDAGLRPYVPGT